VEERCPTQAGVPRGRRPLVGPYRCLWNWSWCCCRGEPQPVGGSGLVRGQNVSGNGRRSGRTGAAFTITGNDQLLTGVPTSATKPPRQPAPTHTATTPAAVRVPVERASAPGLVRYVVAAVDHGRHLADDPARWSSRAHQPRGWSPETRGCASESRGPRCRGSPPRPIPRWTEHQDPPRRRWPEPADAVPAHFRSNRCQSAAPAQWNQCRPRPVGPTTPPARGGDPGLACSRQAMGRPGICLICAETGRPGPAEPRKDHTADSTSFDTGLCEQRNVVEPATSDAPSTTG